MAGKILFAILLFGSAALAQTRPHSQRYLSIYADDVTDTWADYDEIKNLMRQYWLAWQAKDSRTLKKITSPSLYRVLNAKSPALSFHPDLLEIRDLAIYRFRDQTFVQFDLFDTKLGREHVIKSWYVVSRHKKALRIETIHEHFDPDAGP